ncbi:MAG: rod shape-determining protein MreC [Clostridia bacterium]|nr:rod shape-determining protein MreC [Clostridia bacterium]
MRWIKNHKLIVVLVIILLASGFMFLKAMESESSNNPGSSLVNSVLQTITKPFVSIADSISTNIGDMFSYKDLEAENKALKEENEKLRSELNENQLTSSEYSDLKRMARALDYEWSDGKDLESANITAYDGTTWMQVVTIDKGKADGISVNDIAVYGQALVGRVSEVGKHWAKIVTIMDEDCNVSFRAQRNSGIMGVAEKAQEDGIKGYMMDSNSTIAKGDKLVTTGIGLYPKGIELGTVKEITYDSDRQLQTVVITPSIDFTSLQKVTVIK